MAKSIYAILDDVTTETSVPAAGKDADGNVQHIEHTLPRELFPTSEQFEDEAKLLEWAEENGYTHGCLQRGIQKFIIECRAAYKSHKKNETWSPELGQDNVNAMKWSTVTRPQQGKNQKAIAQAIMAENLKNYQMMIDVAGMTEKKMTSFLNEKYENNETIVNSFLEALTF